MWRFELVGTDYVPVGEIQNAKERKVQIALNKLDQLSFRLRMDNVLAEQISRCEGFVKGWRNDILQFYGPIITAEEVGDAEGASVSVACQSGAWALMNKSYANMVVDPSLGVRTNMDRALIVKGEIDAANAWGETGVSTAALPISSAEAVTYTIDQWMPMADLMRTMQTGDNTFDWRMVPINNWDDVAGAVTSPKHTAFWAAPVLGTQQDEAIWEYGKDTRANLQGYRNMVSRETQITVAVSLPDVSTFYTATADGATMTKWGTLTEIVTRDDITDTTQMADLRFAHIDTRKNPRRITTWEPHIDPTGLRMPDYGFDYEVGDIVHGRGVANDVVRFDGLFRCWGVEFEIMDSGFEKANLVVVEEES